MVHIVLQMCLYESVDVDVVELCPFIFKPLRSK